MLNFLFLAAQRYSIAIAIAPTITIIRPFFIVFRIFVGECTRGGSIRVLSESEPNFAITQFVATSRYKTLSAPISPYQCIREEHLARIEEIGSDLDVVAQKFGRK